MKTFNLIVLLIRVLHYSNTGMSVNVLLIGDSVDRFMVEHFCNSRRNVSHEPTFFLSTWGGTILKSNDYSKQASKICSNNLTTIANLHIFGSKPMGPYLWVKREKNKMNVYDTKPRIFAALPLYFSEVGIPNKIVYNSVIWDGRMFSYLQKLNSSDPIWNDTLRDFSRNINDRITDIESIANPYGVEVTLRTAPRTNRHSNGDFDIGELMDAFNIIMREIGRQRNISIFDFDNDAWSTVHWNHTDHNHNRIFLDDVHPNQIVGNKAAETLLDLIDNRWYIRRNAINATELRPNFNPIPNPNHEGNRVYQF